MMPAAEYDIKRKDYDRMNTKYAEQIMKKLLETGTDAVFISPSNDLRLLLGFSPFVCERFQGLFFTADGRHFYICNRLSADEIRPHLGDIPLYVWSDCDRYLDLVETALTRHGLINGRIGVLYHAPGSWLMEVADRCPVTWVSFYKHMNESRIIKSAQELENLRQASQITDRAWEDLLGYIRPGRSVSDISDFLKGRMQEYGGRSMGCHAYEKKAAGYPHYVMPKISHVMEETDSLLVDFGCTVNGYYSDCTRTVFLGEVTDKEKELYELVRKANLTAEESLMLGAVCSDVDAAARNVIEEGGYGEYFTTRLGHGIGINGHEAPDISAVNEIRLQRGMSFTIEPGIYIPGVIGIRIEDVCIINEDGQPEVLNKTSKELTVIS